MDGNPEHNVLRALEALTAESSPQDVADATKSTQDVLGTLINQIKRNDDPLSGIRLISSVMTFVPDIPVHGDAVWSALCLFLRDNGGIDQMIQLCSSESDELHRLACVALSNSLNFDNVKYVVSRNVTAVVTAAQRYCAKVVNEDTEIGIGILSSLCIHSPESCNDLIRMGCLHSVYLACPLESTQNRCAEILSIFALYANEESISIMLKTRVADWLQCLFSSENKTASYLACLGITILLCRDKFRFNVAFPTAKKTLIRFVASVSLDMPLFSAALRFGKDWYAKFSGLKFDSEDVCCIAALQFYLDSSRVSNSDAISAMIGVKGVEVLKLLASKMYPKSTVWACKTLELIKVVSEGCPFPLPKQADKWCVEDVQRWISQKGFEDYKQSFLACQVDGDILLRITNQKLHQDLGVNNSIIRDRLQNSISQLRYELDFSESDPHGIRHFLDSVGPSYLQYTYCFIKAGIEVDNLSELRDDQLLNECGVELTAHRQRILNSSKTLKSVQNGLWMELEKQIDFFISYRRSNGSQMASLLAVYLRGKKYRAFLDVDSLGGGRFDLNTLAAIAKSKVVIAVLTQDALTRCIGDIERKDWMHREVYTAIQAGVKIVPVFLNFEFPPKDSLPTDIQEIVNFNGTEWNHKQQDACINQILAYSNLAAPVAKYNSSGEDGGSGSGSSDHSDPQAKKVKKPKLDI